MVSKLSSLDFKELAALEAAIAAAGEVGCERGHAAVMSSFDPLFEDRPMSIGGSGQDIAFSPSTPSKPLLSPEVPRIKHLVGVVFQACRATVRLVSDGRTVINPQWSAQWVRICPSLPEDADSRHFLCIPQGDTLPGLFEVTAVVEHAVTAVERCASILEEECGVATTAPPYAVVKGAFGDDSLTVVLHFKERFGSGWVVGHFGARISVTVEVLQESWETGISGFGLTVESLDVQRPDCSFRIVRGDEDDQWIVER